jgi:predicted DNA-binding transcriptional regulator YafY
MLDTSSRLLRLLSLLQTRRFWSGAELAERLEVTERTVRRDVDRLRSLGYPVDATSGVAGGYQLGAGASLPPLLLEDDEALAVSIALGTAAASAVTGVEEAAVRALVKLEHVLPPRLRRRMNALRAAVVPIQREMPSVGAATLSIIASACRDSEQLRFSYEGRSGENSERLVEPQGLVHAGYRWYLVAWDVNRADFRTFRVDRIVGEITPGARFLPRPPPEGDLKAYVSRSLSTGAYPLRARVILHAPREDLVKRFSPAAALIQSIDDERSLIETGGRSLESLAGWILMMGVEFTIEEPPELNEYMVDLHARLGRSLKRSAVRRAQRRAPAGGDDVPSR